MLKYNKNYIMNFILKKFEGDNISVRKSIEEIETII